MAVWLFIAGSHATWLTSFPCATFTCTVALRSHRKAALEKHMQRKTCTINLEEKLYLIEVISEGHKTVTDLWMDVWMQKHCFWWKWWLLLSLTTCSVKMKNVIFLRCDVPVVCNISNTITCDTHTHTRAEVKTVDQTLKYSGALRGFALITFPLSFLFEQVIRNKYTDLLNTSASCWRTCLLASYKAYTNKPLRGHGFQSHL